MVPKQARLYIGIVFMSLLVSRTVEAMVKRSDDPHPLEIVVQNLASQVLDLQAKLSALGNTVQQLQATENQKVVFTASISQQNLKASPGHTIPFTRVITNVGNAYDAVTSAFRAPYDGQYMFFVSVDVSPDYKALHISCNGHIMIPGHNDAGDHHIVAGGAISLSAGDEVTIQHDKAAVGTVDGGPEAIFCGFKI